MNNEVLSLPNRAFLRIHGADADAFLHSQLTVSVPGTPVRPRLAAWCDARGRTVALFRVFPLGAQDWLLSFPADLKETVSKRLKMFVLRSQVDIEDVSDRYGHCVSPSQDAGNETVAPILELPIENGWQEWLTEVSSNASDATAALIRASIPEVFAETSAKWVPQWLNLDQLEAIDFDKGCYPGQEVVAKLQYRGSVKRRLARRDITDGKDDLGEEVISTDTEGLFVSRV